MTNTYEIISPIPGKGLDRPTSDHPFLSRAIVKDEFNYIELGLIVRDSTGTGLDSSVVDVTATDSAQNKHMNGTGNMIKIYIAGKPVMVPFYPYHYEFHTPGDHNITFTVDGVPTAVDFLNVPTDTRP